MRVIDSIYTEQKLFKFHLYGKTVADILAQTVIGCDDCVAPCEND